MDKSLFNPTLDGPSSPLPSGDGDILAAACPALFPEGSGVYQHYDVAAYESLPYSPAASDLESAVSAKPLQEYMCTHTHEVEMAVDERSSTPACQHVITVKFSQDRERISISLLNPDGSVDVSCSRATFNAASKKPRLICAGLIICAISSMGKKCARLQEINSWIVDNFNYFQKPKNQKKIVRDVQFKLNVLKVFQRIGHFGCDWHDAWTLIINRESFKHIFLNSRSAHLSKSADLLQALFSEAAVPPQPCQEYLCSSPPRDEVRVRFSSDRSFIHMNLIAANREVLKTFQADTNNLILEKPDLTVPGLIICAICSMVNRRASLREIRSWVVDNFNYFKEPENNKRVYSRLRYHVSRNKLFESQRDTQFGEVYWTLTNDEDAFEEFTRDRSFAIKYKNRTAPSNTKNPCDDDPQRTSSSPPISGYIVSIKRCKLFPVHHPRPVCGFPTR